ncbi:MAG: hypothetical protein AAFQ13_10510, partial [Pseudomonadota bacterium]
MLSLGAILAGLRLFAGGAFEWALKGLSAALNWLTEDAWRLLALLGFGACAWLMVFAVWPTEKQRDDALADAAENLAGWIAERAAHGQSIENIRAASAA